MKRTISLLALAVLAVALPREASAATRAITVVNRSGEAATVLFAQSQADKSGSGYRLESGSSHLFELRDVPTSVRFTTPHCGHLVHNLSHASAPATVYLEPGCTVRE